MTQIIISDQKQSSECGLSHHCHADLRR